MSRTAYTGATIFDGRELHEGAALVMAGGTVAGILPEAQAGDARRVTLDGGVVTPGFVDVQVNGGGGVMLNDDPSLATLRVIADAHRTLGSAAILPTLITDTPRLTRAAVEATVEAVEARVPGIAGLHLEGPHLSVARKGAHAAELIRPMEGPDLGLLLEAAARLPALMVTVAPESVTPAQIRRLSDAGVIVSLGHSDCDHAAAMAARAAGARCVTHLFNAMSQVTGRAPGLAGAALSSDLVAGLIADGIHVHPATLALAFAAKGAEGLCLVTDAMACAGSGIESFTLNGRTILRREGRLTLEDGTLAGADLTLPRAIEVLTGQAGVPLTQALRAATLTPARLIGATRLGHLHPGVAPRPVHLGADGQVTVL